MEYKILKYIETLTKAKESYYDISRKNKAIKNYDMAMFFEGQGTACEKTINDLRKILGIKICELDGKVCNGMICIHCPRFNMSEVSEDNKYDNGGYRNGRN